MRLGVDITSITPPVPIAMGGYSARAGAARGVHDPLTARTLVLEDGGRRMALLVADLLLFSGKQVERIRRRAAKWTGMAQEDVVVAATHTHSGPLTLDAPHLGGAANPEYLVWLEGTLADSIRRAGESLVPVRLGWASVPVRGVGARRRAGAVDGTGGQEAGDLSVLAFAGADGSVRAVLLHYACHPTVMGPDNLLLSADLPGAARAALEHELQGRVPVLYLNGACGDVSTRFTRRAQTFDELERLGAIIGGAAASALRGIVYREVANGGVWASRTVVDLPRRFLPPLPQALAELADAEARWQRVQAEAASGRLVDHGALRLARTALEGAQIQTVLAHLAAGDGGEGESVLESRAEVAAWRLGDCGLATIPGELFWSLGQEIGARSGLDCCLVIGYAGGHVGYIPDEAAYDEGGYEVLSSHLSRDAGAMLVSTAAALFRQQIPRGRPVCQRKDS